MRFDYTSDQVVLVYVGDGRPIDGVPARDLTENDLCRIAHKRALTAVSGDVGQPIDREDPGAGLIERPDPRKVDQQLATEIYDELIDRGHFEAAPKPKAEKKPKEAKAAPDGDSPAPEPTTPTDETPDAPSAKEA
jgi:hypothetical protein